MIENEDWKKYLTRETEAVEEGTFMYQLHECGFFDKAKFFRLILMADQLIESGNGIADYNDLVCSLADCFLYVMSSLYYHLDPEDAYVIENYNGIKDDVPKYFDDIRDVLMKLISC